MIIHIIIDNIQYLWMLIHQNISKNNDDLKCKLYKKKFIDLNKLNNSHDIYGKL